MGPANSDKALPTSLRAKLDNGATRDRQLHTAIHLSLCLIEPSGAGEGGGGGGTSLL